jgi:hypothetical protein
MLGVLISPFCVSLASHTAGTRLDIKSTANTEASFPVGIFLVLRWRHFVCVGGAEDGDPRPTGPSDDAGLILLSRSSSP